MSEFIEFPQHLVIQVTPELHTLLKITLKAHPKLYSLLINVRNTSPFGLWGAHLLRLRS